MTKKILDYDVDFSPIWKIINAEKEKKERAHGEIND